ncbi:FHA domain-containing protein [Hyalangium versicolor]|uniref:FHA domain-containing protein n=1 Tax=Hyalangium versicolor TaxID=2861190 RepID=UPI001CCF6DFB|nr:FHA domain-containing protein [Hyalangium versicolor]
MFSIAVVLGGTRVPTKGTLSSREIFVGRSKKCHLVLKDDTVSGIHCRLVAIEGGVIVLDEGSTNGTWLNGELVVQPTVMTADDELRVGPYLLMVRSLSGGVSAATPRVHGERPQRVTPPPASEASPLTERPVVEEQPTDMRFSQAQLFWTLLGFEQPGTLEQARAAYQARTEECQPDKLARLGTELRSQAEQRLREVTFAWEYIQRLLRKSRDAA